MAVSPLRALVTVHLQGTWNRLGRQLGLRGRLIFGVVLMSILSISLLPALVGIATLGFGAGGFLDEPSATKWVPIAAAGLTLFPLVGGLLGGIAGGARQLPWEALQAYPVRPRTLFMGELVAGAGEALTLIEVTALGLFCAAASVGRPSATPYFAVLFLTHALTMLALQQLVGSLGQLVAKRFGLVLLILPLLGASMAWLAPALADRVNRGHWANWGQRLDRLTRLLPARELLEAARTGEGTARALGVATAMLLFVLALAFVFVAREKQNEPERESGRPIRLWSFRTPTWGVARLQWQGLASSLPGRFGLVMPLVTIVLIRGPFASAFAGKSWAPLGAFAYASLAGTNLLFNQFGLDRHGVKGLLLLPIEHEVLLKGKLLGFAAWQAIQAFILLGLLVLVGQREVMTLLSGLALYACIFLTMAMVGQFVSVWQPRPLQKNGLRASQPPLPVTLIILGTLAGLVLTLGGLLLAVHLTLPGWEFAVLTTAGLVLLALTIPVMRFNARFLRDHREKLVEVLGASG